MNVQNSQKDAGRGKSFKVLYGGVPLTDYIKTAIESDFQKLSIPKIY